MSKFKLTSSGTVRYSPNEQRLFALLRKEPRDTGEISELHYNGSIPFNGRKIIIGALMSLVHKVKANKEPFQIAHTKRQGPIPMSFWLVGN